jgi:hypothetical protein
MVGVRGRVRGQMQDSLFHVESNLPIAQDRSLCRSLRCLGPVEKIIFLFSIPRTEDDI